MAESSPSERLAELVLRVRRTAETSVYLIERARAACARSVDATFASQLLYDERAAWAEILASATADPDHVVVLCARCHRARGRRRWTDLPPGVEYELMGWNSILVSHGYCPDCLHEMEAATHPSFRPEETPL